MWGVDYGYTCGTKSYMCTGSYMCMYMWCRSMSKVSLRRKTDHRNSYLSSAQTGHGTQRKSTKARHIDKDIKHSTVPGHDTLYAAYGDPRTTIKYRSWHPHSSLPAAAQNDAMHLCRGPTLPTMRYPCTHPSLSFPIALAADASLVVH